MVALDSHVIAGDARVRTVFAAAATFIGVGTIVTRSTAAVDWPLVSVTVAAFWLWALRGDKWRLPLYALGLSIPIVLNLTESEAEVSMFFVVLSVSMLAALESNRRLVAAVITVTLATIGVLSWTGAFDDFSWPNWFFGILFSWGFGEIVHRYSLLIDELQRTRSLVADQAAAHERRRIARDVHDLVGHSLSVVMLHVTGARHVLRRDPDEAERALEQAELAGRESLAEIRRTVGLLRDDSDAEGAGLPAPELTDVPTLVDEFVAAGIAVDLSVKGDLDRVNGPTGLAAYRIIQEALTNASRHAPGAQTTVDITLNGAALNETGTFDVVVRNRGGTQASTANGSGFGLVSMRERARSVGGSLIVGPSPDGWTVEATLPIETPEVVA